MVFSSKRDIRLTYGQHFICAGLAGASAKSITAPLDFVKIRTQVGAQETRNGIFKTFSNVYKTEGIRAFWKGNLMGCARVMPYALIQVIAFQRLRLLLADNTGRLNSNTALIAGSGAGLMATVILYPTDVIKTRLIVQKGNSQYNKICKTAGIIIKEEGIKGLYKGIFTSVIGSIPYAATMYLIYECFDNIQHNIGLSSSQPFFLFLSGSVASASAQTMSFPFDTVRKKIQAQCGSFTRDKRIDVKVSGMTDTMTNTVKKYGLPGLWKGSLINIMRVVPYTGLMYITYEIAKVWCLHTNGYVSKPFENTYYSNVDQSFKPNELDEFLEEIEANQEIQDIYSDSHGVEDL